MGIMSVLSSGTAPVTTSAALTIQLEMRRSVLQPWVEYNNRVHNCVLISFLGGGKCISRNGLINLNKPKA